MFVVAYKYYKYLEHSLLIGNPVQNRSVIESKKNKMFICSYSDSDNDIKTLKEVWLEKKASISKDCIEIKKGYLLQFSFLTEKEAKLNFIYSSSTKIKSNFKTGDIGLSGNIFSIGVKDKNIIEKDTLRISILYDKRYINKIFLRMK